MCSEPKKKGEYDPIYENTCTGRNKKNKGRFKDCSNDLNTWVAGLNVMKNVTYVNKK